MLEGIFGRRDESKQPQGRVVKLGEPVKRAIAAHVIMLTDATRHRGLVTHGGLEQANAVLEGDINELRVVDEK